MTTREISFTYVAGFNPGLGAVDLSEAAMKDQQQLMNKSESQRILLAMYQHGKKHLSAYVEMTVYDTSEFKVAS